MHALATPDISVEIDVDALYRSQAAAVLARCRRMLRNDADAEEACQEVFLRAHRFDGDLVDDDGAVIGRIEGNLTTTTGQGTWWLESGEEGSWALGRQ